MSDDQAFWDGIHRERGRSEPHPYLVDAIARTSAGSALELGCGDGANAVWLATHGWEVTAVDVSQVALDRATEHAERAGVAARVRCQRADLRHWSADGTFDLVAALFLHTPLEMDYAEVLARAAGRVRAGGTLLVVGHYTLPPWAWDPDDTDGLPSAAELASALGLHAPDWRVRLGDEVPRTVTARDGRESEVLDAILHADRLTER